MDIQKIYHPILTHFRRQRVSKFYNFFNITSSTKLLDVGGNMFFWDLGRSKKIERVWGWEKSIIAIK
ncbi:MAG: hypothetical protein AAGJ08_08240 [Cyanobacteria bacterium P01_H01_bin.35]